MKTVIDELNDTKAYIKYLEEKARVTDYQNHMIHICNGHAALYRLEELIHELDPLGLK